MRRARLDRSSQPALGELDQSLVAARPGPCEDALDVLAKPWLAPVVAGGRLGALRLTGARRLEQRLGRGGIVRGIVARWKSVAASRCAAASVLVDERA